MNKSPIPTPKRESHLKHRQAVNRQILLPVILVAVVGLGLAVLSAFGAAGNNPGVNLWADISIIWLIIPMMLMALITIALMIAIIYGFKNLLDTTPHYTGILQDWVLWLNAEIKIWANKITKPVLSIKTWLDLIINNEDKDEQQKRN